MADNTNIEWTDATWNPIVGCSIVSPGCTNCYAMRMAARIEMMHEGRHLKHGDGVYVPPTPYAGLTREVNGHPVWTGKLALASEETLTAPLSWKRPRRIFVNSMGDLFHEDVPDAWIDRVFAVMALCPQHTFQVLTKRAKRMRKYIARLHADFFGLMEETWNETQCDTIGDLLSVHRERILADNMQLAGGKRFSFPLSNVWLGVSAEDQPRADERIPELLATPAAVRFVSLEPLLGAIDLERCGRNGLGLAGDTLRWPAMSARSFGNRLDWVIVGGESGPGARPMHPDWPLSIRDQCAAAFVSFFFKQWGEWGFDERVGRKEMRGDDQRYPIDERPGVPARVAYRYTHWVGAERRSGLCPLIEPRPVRLQLSRKKGFNLQAWSREVNGLPAVSVTRPGKWGNRYRIGDVVQRFSREKICETFKIETVNQAVECFREEYRLHLANPKAEALVRAALDRELRGRNLGCWCALDAPCHADVLLQLANVDRDEPMTKGAPAPSPSSADRGGASAEEGPP